MMDEIHLNEIEWAELKKPIRGEGGFQSLMHRLRQRAAIRGGKLTLSEEEIEQIRRYAFDYKDGGFEGRLRRMFERHLGPKLDGKN